MFVSREHEPLEHEEAATHFTGQETEIPKALDISETISDDHHCPESQLHPEMRLAISVKLVFL